MLNAIWFSCDNCYLFGLGHIIICFCTCLIAFWRMYLCQFHYECVCIFMCQCVFVGVFAFVTVIFMCLTRLIQTRSIAGITSDAQLNRQRRFYKNG